MKTDNIDNIRNKIDSKVEDLEHSADNYEGFKLLGEKDRINHNECAKYIKHKYPLLYTEYIDSKFYKQYDEGFWQHISAQEIKGIVIKELEKLKIIYSAYHIKSILDILTPMIYMKPEIIFRDNNYLNLNNVIYDFNHFQYFSHERRYYMHYKTSYNFDENAKCEKFDEALKMYSKDPRTGQPDEDWIKTFWEIAGYVMLGEHPFHKMFWLFGSKGRNGKGTLERILTKLVGNELTFPNLSFKDLSNRFYKGNLIGKRLAIVGDMPPKLDNIAIIKELTGGDVLSTDVKFKSTMSFESSAKIIMAMNQLPDLPPNQSLDPIIRRIVLLPFENSFNEIDIDIEKKFEQELSGIFNKAIDGLQRLLRNKTFTECTRGQDILRNYRRNANPFVSFLHSALIADPKGEVWGFEIMKAFKKYLENTTINSHKLDIDPRIFYRKVREVFPEIESEERYCPYPGKQSDLTIFFGIRLNGYEEYNDDYDSKF